jgi:transcriptional regulator with XRE-family HTH domain
MQQVMSTTWLKALRTEADLTQEQLAFRLGVCVSTIRTWERRPEQPAMTLKQWEAFAEAVNIPLSELSHQISRLASAA